MSDYRAMLYSYLLLDLYMYTYRVICYARNSNVRDCIIVPCLSYLHFRDAKYVRTYVRMKSKFDKWDVSGKCEFIH